MVLLQTICTLDKTSNLSSEAVDLSIDSKVIELKKLHAERFGLLRAFHI